MKDRLTEEQLISYPKDGISMAIDTDAEKKEDRRSVQNESSRTAERKRAHQHVRSHERGSGGLLVDEAERSRDEDRKARVRREMLGDPRKFLSKEAIDRLPEGLTDDDWLKIGNLLSSSPGTKSPDLDPESLAHVVQVEALGLSRSIGEDVARYEEPLRDDDDSTIGLRETLHNDNFNPKIFAKRLDRHMERLSHQLEGVISEREFAKLKFQLKNDFAEEVRGLHELTYEDSPSEYMSRAANLINQMSDFTRTIRELRDEDNKLVEGSYASGGNGRGRGGPDVPRRPRRGEAQGRSPERLGMARINSIEDVAYYMELGDPKYNDEVKEENRILVPRRNEKLEKYYAFRIGDNYMTLPRTTDDIAQFTIEQIENLRTDTNDPEINEFNARIKELYNMKQFEEVRIVNPTNFMNWIRDRWVGLHSDDPDNPQDFFNAIAIDHPDMYRIVTAANLHKQYGTFLRSKFLRDEDHNRVVYSSLREEIIKEVWVTSGIRNNEVIFKQIMPIDEKLFEIFRDKIAIGNLYAKNAFEGKSTIASFFSLAEDFQEKNFNYLTGKKDTDITPDTRLGSAILLAYFIYYNITDFNHLKIVLGDKPTMFNKQNILKAIKESMVDSDVYKTVNEINDDMAIAYLKTPKTENDFFLDKNIFDNNGDLKSDEKSIQEFLKFFNPFSPAQKPLRVTAAIRKMVENQVQDMTDIQKDRSASGFAELLAWLTVYHTGAAARHDQPVQARNSQVKYEYPEGYKDKQVSRDAAGNLYNLHSLKRAGVPMMEGMPTINGEILIDILEEAVRVRTKVSSEINEQIKQIQNREDVKRKKEDIRNQVATGDIPEIRNLQEQLAVLDKNTSLYEKRKKQIEDLIEKETDRRLIANEPDLKQAYERLKNLDKTVDNILRRLEFDEAQFLQYAGMEMTNGAQLMLEDVSGADLPSEEVTPLDKDNRRTINAQKFSEWMQGGGLEKRMRYVLATWPLPLGAEVRRMINVRDSKNPPRYQTMTIFETIFGNKDSDVMAMFQTMILREAEEENKKRVEKSEEEVRKFKWEKKKHLQSMSHEEYEKKLKELEEKHKKIALVDVSKCHFADKTGRVTSRENLKYVLGYVEHERDKDGKTTRIIHHDPAFGDPATLAVKAYQKVRISNFLLSHTDKRSPYEFWEVEMREGFFRGLALSHYFNHHDIEDMERLSNNMVWLNAFRSVGPALLRSSASGIFGGLFHILKSAFSS